MKVDIQLLEKQLREHVDDYLKLRQSNMHVSRVVLLISATFSASTTVLIGLSTAFSNPASKIYAIIALITSAIVTVIGSWDSLFNHKKLWILYTDHWILMQNLLMDFEHLKAQKETEETDFEKIYEDFKKIRNSLQDEWIKMKEEDFKQARQVPSADAEHTRG